VGILFGEIIDRKVIVACLSVRVGSGQIPDNSDLVLAFRGPVAPVVAGKGKVSLFIHLANGMDGPRVPVSHGMKGKLGMGRGLPIHKDAAPNWIDRQPAGAATSHTTKQQNSAEKKANSSRLQGNLLQVGSMLTMSIIMIMILLRLLGVSTSRRDENAIEWWTWLSRGLR
jgi:hypothetical protein